MQANEPPVRLEELEAKDGPALPAGLDYTICSVAQTEELTSGATLLPHAKPGFCVLGIHPALPIQSANSQINDKFSIMVSRHEGAHGNSAVKGAVVFVQRLEVPTSIDDTSTVPSRSSTPESQTGFNTTLLTMPTGPLDASYATTSTVVNTPSRSAENAGPVPAHGTAVEGQSEGTRGRAELPPQQTPVQSTTSSTIHKEGMEFPSRSALPAYRTFSVCTVLATPADVPTDILRRALASLSWPQRADARSAVLGLSQEHPMRAYDGYTTAPLLALDPSAPVLSQLGTGAATASSSSEESPQGTAGGLYLVLRLPLCGNHDVAPAVHAALAPSSPVPSARQVQVEGPAMVSPSVILGRGGPNGHLYTPGTERERSSDSEGEEPRQSAFSLLATGLRPMPVFAPSSEPRSQSRGHAEGGSRSAGSGSSGAGSTEGTPPQEDRQRAARTRMNPAALAFSPGAALPTSVASSVLLSPPPIGLPPGYGQCDVTPEGQSGANNGAGAASAGVHYFDSPSPFQARTVPPLPSYALEAGMQCSAAQAEWQMLQLQAQLQAHAWTGGMFGSQSLPLLYGLPFPHSPSPMHPHLHSGRGMPSPGTHPLGQRNSMLYALGSAVSPAAGLGWQGPGAGYISTPMPGRGGYNERLLQTLLQQQQQQQAMAAGDPQTADGHSNVDSADWQAIPSPHMPARDLGHGRQHAPPASSRATFPRHASTIISRHGAEPVTEAEVIEQAHKHVWLLQQGVDALLSHVQNQNEQALYQSLSSLVCVPSHLSPTGRHEPKPVAEVRGKTLLSCVTNIDYGEEPVKSLPDILSDIGAITFERSELRVASDIARVAYMEAGAVPVLVELARILQCRDRTTDAALEFTIQALCNIAYHPRGRDMMTRPDSGLLELICDIMRSNPNLNIHLKCARTVDALVWENTPAQQRAAYLGICELAVESIQRNSIDPHVVLNLARMLSAVARTVETLKAIQVAGIEEACKAVKQQQYSEGWEDLLRTAVEGAKNKEPSPSRLLRQGARSGQPGTIAAAGLHLLARKASRADGRML